MSKQRLPATSTLVEGILSGDRYLLSRAITLVESQLPMHRELARDIVAACMPHSGKSERVGITGSPGVGKSTFIESLGQYIASLGRRLAVLTIDPSSPVTKGSILGDKTRMTGLSQIEGVYIRPSPSGTWRGGVARMTRESMILCEAAGFDTILIETVGVGQSETAVHSMTDLYLLLLLPGAGDDLQGIKRGSVEMADLVVINQADGDRIAIAQQTQYHYQHALHFFPRREDGWMPRALLCSALQQTGIRDIWASVTSYFQQMKENGFLESNRRQQARDWLLESIADTLNRQFMEHPAIRERWPEIEKAVLENRLSPFAASDLLIEAYRDRPV